MELQRQISNIEIGSDHGTSLAQTREAIAHMARMAELYKMPQIYTLLRDLRLRASQEFWESEAPQSPQTVCEVPPNIFNNVAPNRLPEIAASELTGDTVKSAIYHHGALIIRGLLSEKISDKLKRNIKACLNEFDAYNDGQKDRNYSFYNPEFSGGYEVPKNMKFLRMNGSFRTAMSPLMMHRLTKIYDKIGLRDVLADYFGTDPYISFKKWVLRQNKPLQMEADWHQDGAFMGSDIKTLNVWAALTECGSGTNKCGMDIVPKRLTEIVPTGTEGANFSWSVSGQFVKDNMPVCRPHFQAGDGIIFDQFNLHRTSFDKDFTEERYAVETWFFAQDGYAPAQLPIIW